MSKRLIARSKLSNRQLGQLIDFFALEVPAVKAASVLQINRHSAERIYQIIRHHLARDCERCSPLRGDVEAEESYFDGYRKGRRGRGAAGKVAVLPRRFRSPKGTGQVYTNVTRETLRTVIRQKVPQYYGIPRNQFVLYLKEMEFRFNHRHEDLPLLIRRILNTSNPVLD